MILNYWETKIIERFELQGHLNLNPLKLIPNFRNMRKVKVSSEYSFEFIRSEFKLETIFILFILSNSF